MNIRAILLDFDGTSLQRDQVYISFRNMRALRAALDKGIEIIPCTGRCEDMFPPLSIAVHAGGIRHAVQAV